MLTNLDLNVKRIFESLGTLDNTKIIIVSDNGGETSNGASNYPLRGEKFTYFEGGIRTPCLLINFQKVEERVSTVDDMLPTILDSLNVGYEEEKFTGTSLFRDVKEEYKVMVDPVYVCGVVFWGSFKGVFNGTCGYDVILGKEVRMFLCFFLLLFLCKHFLTFKPVYERLGPPCRFF